MRWWERRMSSWVEEKEGSVQVCRMDDMLR